jgi:hypothetical protein
MKTPMQELIKELKDLQESLDPYGLHDAIEFAESMLEKEKEAMCDFAEYVRKCGQQSDHRGLMTNEELFEETFKKK